MEIKEVNNMNEMVKDSGSTQEFTTGAHRDNANGKGRCDLLPLKYVAMVMNDAVLENIDRFMETRDVSHLVKAICDSVNLVPCFRLDEIEKFLNDNNIETVKYSNNSDAVRSQLAHMMLEASKLYEAGANKYGANNWKLGMPVNRYIDSGVRHYLKTLRGDIDEPHYRGFVWNLLCAMWTAENHPELNYSENPVPSQITK